MYRGTKDWSEKKKDWQLMVFQNSVENVLLQLVQLTSGNLIDVWLFKILVGFSL